MPAILFYLVLPFLYFISILPFPLLYLLSDGLYLVLYYIIGYRKKVVITNLRNAFPGKNEKELEQISKAYYRYLCDLFLEVIKFLTISNKSMVKHCIYPPEYIELFNKYAEKKKSIILVMGHWGNWEWSGNAFSLVCRQQLYVIYHPLHNKQFNRLIYSMRSRFGTKLIAMKDTLREMLSHKNDVSATAFVADQTPPPEGAYWTTFLNQDTPVFNGTEKIARKINYTVFYARVKRIKRGYYTISAEVIAEEPAKTNEGEITELYIRKLEKDIIEMPEIWLWSHRRWKHKRINKNSV